MDDWYVFTGKHTEVGTVEGRRVWWHADRECGPISKAKARRVVDQWEAHHMHAEAVRCRVEHVCNGLPRLIEILPGDEEVNNAPR